MEMHSAAREREKSIAARVNRFLTAF